MKILRRLLLAGLITVLLFQLLIAAGWLFAPRGDADYVLVLGAMIEGDQPSPLLDLRIEKGREYLLEYPQSLAVLCGGIGAGETYSEAYVMAKTLEERGIDPTRLLLEDASTNTWTNLKNAVSLIETKTGERPQSLVVATSDYHVLRVRLLGSRLGIRIYPLPSKTPLSAVAHDYGREMFALIKSLLFDRE